MKKFMGYFLLGMIVTATPASIMAFMPSSREKVLSENVEATPTPSPSPTPTLSPRPRPTPNPTLKPSPTPIPAPIFTSEQINGFIERFAAQYGVDPNVLRHIALCESGFDPLAENVGYGGLYQFGPTTWKNFRKQIGEDPNADLRFNAEEAVQTAAYAFSQGKRGIWPNCAP